MLHSDYHEKGVESVPFEVDSFPTQDFAPASRSEFWMDSFPPKKAEPMFNVTRKPGYRPEFASSQPQIMFTSRSESPVVSFPSTPKHTVSLPHSQSSLDLSQHSPELRLPMTNVINAETLDRYMGEFASKILFLDVRKRSSFDSRRFPSANVVCIDPAILREGITAFDLEAILRTSPVTEQELFQNRASFELVVYYDDNASASKGLNPGHPMWWLVDCIYTKVLVKPLKRAPCLLLGGLEAWMECLGAESVWVTYSPPATHPLPSRPQVALNDARLSTYTTDVASYFRADNFSTSPEYTLGMERLNISALSAPARQSQKTASSMGMTPYVPPNQVHHAAPAPLQFSEFATGLVNLGNTCYMNCILQCLVGTKALGEMFVKGEYRVYPDSKLGSQGQLANGFSRVARTMYQAALHSGRGRVSYIAPKELKFVCGKLSESYQRGEQQDCHEFLNFLLDGLHEDLNARGNRPPLKQLTEKEEKMREAMDIQEASGKEWLRYLNNNESPISRHVQGQYLSRLQCRVCGCQSTTYNAFSCLSVPIRLGYQEVSLEDCFNLFTQPEVLDGDDAWNCPDCKRRQPTIKTMKLVRLPDFFIVHLQRFKHIGGVWGSNKLNTHVRYPGVLNMEPFSLGGQADGGGGLRYKLYGVANHYGSLKGGHYTSYVRREGGYGWCLFDDARVRPRVSWEEVVNKNAYVFFFERERG